MNNNISIILFDIICTIAYDDNDPVIVLNDKHDIKFSFKDHKLKAVLFDKKLNSVMLEVTSNDNYINRMYHSFVKGAIDSYADEKIIIKLGDTEIITLKVK